MNKIEPKEFLIITGVPLDFVSLLPCFCELDTTRTLQSF